MKRTLANQAVTALIDYLLVGYAAVWLSHSIGYWGVLVPCFGIAFANMAFTISLAERK